MNFIEHSPIKLLTIKSGNSNPANNSSICNHACYTINLQMIKDHKKIPPEEISSIFRLAKKKKFFDESENQSAIFFNIEKIQERILDLKNAFPEDTLHAVAIKTNPLFKVLSLLKDLHVGAEAASYPEVIMAIEAGIAPNKIVFDSPAKTENELRESMNLGIHINIDNFTEVERIDKLINQIETDGTFGLRINPQIGAGNIASMSTSGQYSKFGVPINEYRHKIIKIFEKYEWLSGLHVHSGSQGLKIDQMVKGVRKIYDLAEEINDKFRTLKNSQVVKLIDIGGGFPISYHHEVESPDIKKYVLQLKETCPNLFPNYKLTTEFGRFIYGHSGWVASRIEYLKKQKNFTTAIIHVGADLFLRESYNPEDWYHEFSVIDNEGSLKAEIKQFKYQVGGPLCFAGDMIAKNIKLPQLKIGDYLIIRDTGANTVNLWSRHCSRQMPKIIGYYGSTKKFTLLKEKEVYNEILDFWK